MNFYTKAKIDSTFLCSENKTIKMDVFFMLFLLFTSSESMLIGTNSSAFSWTIYKFSLLFILGFLVLFCMIRKKIIYKAFIYYLSLILLIFLNFVITSSNNSFDTYAQILILITSAWIIVNIFDLNQFLETFERTIYFLSVISLVVFGFALVFPSFIQKFPIIVNTGGLKYYNLFFSVVSERSLESSNFFLRNNGIFREPGVYQIFLNLALCIYLFRGKQLKLSRIVVYAFTLVTTFSTTGLIGMLFIFGIYVFFKRKKEKRWISILLILFAISIFVFSSHNNALSFAFNKIFDNENGSTIARKYSFWTNIKLWLKNPLFGTGIYNNELLFPQYVYEEAGQIIKDNTNSYMFTLSCFGIFSFFILMLGLARLSNYIFNGNFLCGIVVFLIILAGENIMYSAIVFVFVFYGLSINTKSLGLFSKIKA